MSSYNSIFSILVFLIIFHTNYKILFRQYPKRIANKVSCTLESCSSGEKHHFSSIYFDGVRTLFLPSYILNGSVLWSNGDGRGDSGDDKREESPPAEETKDVPNEAEAKEVPNEIETKDAAVQTEPEKKKEPPIEEERRSTPGIPDPPHTTSRIPTYDEYARYRNPITPPDSHYPPGPGPYYRRRSEANTVKFNLGFTILGVGVTRTITCR
ncbi:hypothetical protein ABMA27_011906 [Loxostege sticticalis]|uniref:Uncharacterized protein n=1 Tax=Loxostege sticticalis TaxID=481309 RepID=A0ABR3IHX9_LOXSC